MLTKINLPMIRTSRSVLARIYSGLSFNHFPLRSPGSHLEPRSFKTIPSSLEKKTYLDHWKEFFYIHYKNMWNWIQKKKCRITEKSFHCKKHASSSNIQIDTIIIILLINRKCVLQFSKGFILINCHLLKKFNMSKLRVGTRTRTAKRKIDDQEQDRTQDYKCNTSK